MLKEREAELRDLASQGKQDEFFREIIPLLKPLRSYIKRCLRIAYPTQQMRTPVIGSGDVLDDVVLKAYEKFNRKPKRLTLQQWLYRLANEELNRYVSKRTSTEKRQKSLESLTKTELRTLEEMPITADADGEVWFPEELDDSEYQALEFLPPAFDDTPEQQLERREQILEIIRNSRQTFRARANGVRTLRCRRFLKRSCGQNLWRANGRGSAHRGKGQRAYSASDHGESGIEGKKAKRPLDQERLSSYPFIT